MATETEIEEKEIEEAISKEPILQFFQYQHLPEKLQNVSALFYIVAYQIVSSLPRNPERTVALRKLLEAKDAAVRAKIYRKGFI